MRFNVQRPKAFTHEGGPTNNLPPIKELRRSIMACMLWEDSVYESGNDHAKRVVELCSKVSFEDLARLAVDAREKFKLRHAPLLLVREAIRHHKGRKVGDLIARVIQRPDELGELLALYWKDNSQAPLASQLKIGLARALKKFSPYSLAKYNRSSAAVKLRDVLFLSHSRPDNPTQEAIFKAIADNTLTTPDTWEVALSSGGDKRETFTRLLSENKLGALALLRNLRNMIQSGVDEDLIRWGIASMSTERVLPFRFISAAKYAPRLEDILEWSMLRCLEGLPELSGKTALLVDHSSSMMDVISANSEITRFDAACGLAMIIREVCDRARVFAFSNECWEIPPRRGFALAQALRERHFGGTYLGNAVSTIYAAFPECERLIVITDEQSADKPQRPRGLGYIINVATYKNGISYGPWVAIDGWSEAIVDYIRELESEL